MSKNKESEISSQEPAKEGFFFPEHEVTIFAESREEALRLLDAHLNSN